MKQGANKMKTIIVDRNEYYMGIIDFRNGGSPHCHSSPSYYFGLYRARTAWHNARMKAEQNRSK